MQQNLFPNDLIRGQMLYKDSVRRAMVVAQLAERSSFESSHWQSFYLLLTAENI